MRIPRSSTNDQKTPDTFGASSSPRPGGASVENPAVSQIAAFLSWFKHVFDYLGGSREEPPPGMRYLASPLWIGIWWGLMIGLILLFCGQTSKFIYIDF
jgi:hypothetical protein